MVDLSIVTKIWNILIESNTFNFIIFVAAFVLLFKKINLKGIISSLQEKILKVINEANDNKKEAEEGLFLAEKAVENLGAELKTIVLEAEKSAEVISKKILTEAENQIKSIEENAKKVIEAEEKLLVAQLTKNVSLTSVNAAKSNIQKTLQETPSLHEKYINESIDELDRLNF